MLLSSCIRPQKVAGSELIPAMAQKFPLTSGGESGYFSQLWPSRTLRQDETEYQPTHQRKKKQRKEKEERKGERKRPNRRKRQIHLAPLLRQIHVSAEASPTRKEGNKARTRKERNRVSSKYTYQEGAGPEKKKRTSLQNTSSTSHLFRLKISPMSRLNKHQLLLKISPAHFLLVHLNHFSSQYSTSMPSAVHMAQ